MKSKQFCIPQSVADWLERCPKWVNWIAQDRDGIWWAYEHEPNMHHCGWYENEVGHSRKLCQKQAGEESIGLPSLAVNDWKQSIYRID